MVNHDTPAVQEDVHAATHVKLGATDPDYQDWPLERLQSHIDILLRIREAKLRDQIAPVEVVCERLRKMYAEVRASLPVITDPRNRANNGCIVYPLTEPRVDWLSVHSGLCGNPALYAKFQEAMLPFQSTMAYPKWIKQTDMGVPTVYLAPAWLLVAASFFEAYGLTVPWDGAVRLVDSK